MRLALARNENYWPLQLWSKSWIKLASTSFCGSLTKFESAATSRLPVLLSSIRSLINSFTFQGEWRWRGTGFSTKVLSCKSFSRISLLKWLCTYPNFWKIPLKLVMFWDCTKPFKIFIFNIFLLWDFTLSITLNFLSSWEFSSVRINGIKSWWVLWKFSFVVFSASVSVAKLVSSVYPWTSLP